ncbi:MAG: DinB family protein [Candidatus Promineofilum sp.]|nr:DinB family protein [Promineifilum sp.]
MKKEQLLDKIEVAWSGLQASIDGLTSPQMIQPGVTGDWSVKDILGHVTTWEEEALKHLPHILEGKRPPRYSVLYGGIDAFNALKSVENRALSLGEVRARMDDIHARLVDYVRHAPDEQIATETRFRRRIRLDSYSHYPVHAQAIVAWREQTGF